MRTLHVCSELFPLLKTGGLADVAGALPLAQARHGVDARILLPGFPAIMAGLHDAREVAQLDTFAGPVRLLCGRTANGLTLFVIDAPLLYERPGNPYHDANQIAYADNPQRFAVLGWVAALLANGLDAQWQPEVVHGHDWHAGLAFAYLAALGRPAKSVFTIHNLAYQGVFPASFHAELALPAHFFDVHGVEYHGRISFMKAGIFFADRITTVSPSYAAEITTPEQGCGLDGLLRGRSTVLSGILNGVDDAIWNPAIDSLIPARYSAERMLGKAKCKTALQEACGLDVTSDKPLFAVVSRLTEQKGLHLVLACLKEITSRGGQVVVLGSGDAEMECAFSEAAASDPANVAMRIGYDEDFAHRIMAGSDVIMVPSRYEPCGLTQLYGLKYGALPLVRRVGGLADTVIDCTLENLADGCATGMVFDEFSVDGFAQGVRRAFALWSRPKDWKAVRSRAMSMDFGWDHAAIEYAGLYRVLLAAT